jgi:glycosyltransferase involved in cell wall biosynthesis
VLAERAREAGLEVFTGCRFKKGFRPGSFLKDVSRLRTFVREKGVQLYHCHGSQDHWTAAFALRPQVKIVRTRHNIYPVKNHPFNRWLFRKRTAQVITIFSAQAQFFTESGLFAADELFTLHSPLPQEFVDAHDVARVVRQELKLSDSTPLVGFAANFHPDKAPLDFVAAAAKIAKAVPDAQFAMAGHGPLQDALREAIKANGLEGRLHLLGFRKDILQTMASFDLLLLTSVTREASSTVAKQASAVGIPVIATDVGGTREIVEDGRTGVIVKPGDIEALAREAIALLKDHSRAIEMGRRGREKVRSEFSAQAIAARTEELYLTILRR